ncbi:hypothetical protein Dimus_037408 [Dionaea muscipula]
MGLLPPPPLLKYFARIHREAKVSVWVSNLHTCLPNIAVLNSYNDRKPSPPKAIQRTLNFITIGTRKPKEGHTISGYGLEHRFNKNLTPYRGRSLTGIRDISSSPADRSSAKAVVDTHKIAPVKVATSLALAKEAAESILRCAETGANDVHAIAERIVAEAVDEVTKESLPIFKRAKDKDLCFVSEDTSPPLGLYYYL